MKKIKLLTLLGFILGVVFVSETTSDTTICDVELKNIEALANNEQEKGMELCISNGTTECSLGGYVRCTIYGLDKETLLY